MNPPWQPAPSNPDLKPHQVHIWRANIDTPPAPLSSYQSLLSPDELTRAARFKFDIHRNRFIAARGILRQLLARYVARAPQDLVFQYNEHGKPSLENNIQFNVSHSHEWAVYAFCLNQPIGIDIEQQKESVDGLALAQRFFSAAEYEYLQALPPSQQSDYFFQLWAYKEAFIKALGIGLSFPLADFTVSFKEFAIGSVGPKNIDSKLLPQMVQSDATQPSDAVKLSVGATRESPAIDTQSWHLYPITVAEGYNAAIAVEGKVDKIEMWGL